MFIVVIKLMTDKCLSKSNVYWIALAFKRGIIIYYKREGINFIHTDVLHLIAF